MTKAEYQKLKSELLDSGYQPYINHNDLEAAAESYCPKCDGDDVRAEGFKQPGRHGRYSCFAICRFCDEVWEF
ncbi:MAG: hypothetical protein IH587_14535 [Anaerolineae bacterium]|nr:hypothetical protein [Anaerolineae bacterium]